MKALTGLLLGLLIIGCSDSKQNRKVKEITPDTIYDGDIISREKLESMRPTIQLDNGEGQMPTFNIGDTSVLRICIRGLTKYDLDQEEMKGGTILKIDTSLNKFLVIPSDTLFSFQLNQYYPKGTVVRYTRNWDASKSIYDEEIVELDGLTKIGRLDFKAH